MSNSVFLQLVGEVVDYSTSKHPAPGVLPATFAVLLPSRHLVNRVTSLPGSSLFPCCWRAKYEILYNAPSLKTTAWEATMLLVMAQLGDVFLVLCFFVI